MGRKNIQPKVQKGKKGQKTKEKVEGLGNIIGVPKRKKTSKGAVILEDIMMDVFPRLKNNIKPQM